MSNTTNESNTFNSKKDFISLRSARYLCKSVNKMTDEMISTIYKTQLKNRQLTLKMTMEKQGKSEKEKLNSKLADDSKIQSKCSVDAKNVCLREHAQKQKENSKVLDKIKKSKRLIKSKDILKHTKKQKPTNELKVHILTQLLHIQNNTQSSNDKPKNVLCKTSIDNTALKNKINKQMTKVELENQNNSQKLDKPIINQHKMHNHYKEQQSNKQSNVINIESDVSKAKKSKVENEYNLVKNEPKMLMLENLPIYYLKPNEPLKMTQIATNKLKKAEKPIRMESLKNSSKNTRDIAKEKLLKDVRDFRKKVEAAFQMNTKLEAAEEDAQNTSIMNSKLQNVFKLCKNKLDNRNIN